MPLILHFMFIYVLYVLSCETLILSRIDFFGFCSAPLVSCIK